MAVDLSKHLKAIAGGELRSDSKTKGDQVGVASVDMAP